MAKRARRDDDTPEVIPAGGVVADSTQADAHRFEFDLDRAILHQAMEKLDASPSLDLRKGVGPPSSGVYALYHKRRLVYIGKASKGTTKSKRTLRGRLNEHVSKIGGRQNISLDEMHCRFLTFTSEWWVFAAEFALIGHYKPEWNESGFGSKVPGRGRPGTERVSRWDDRFPKKQT
jgi:hypothetical protein